MAAAEFARGPSTLEPVDQEVPDLSPPGGGLGDLDRERRRLTLPGHRRPAVGDAVPAIPARVPLRWLSASAETERSGGPH